MRLIITLRAAFFAILIITGSIPAQETPKAFIVDEFSSLFCTDDFRSRLDHFFMQVSDRPGSLGYVIARADTAILGRAVKYFDLIENNARFRNFDLERLRFIQTWGYSSTHFQFVVVPAGASPPEVEPTAQRLSIKETTLFDSSLIDSAKDGEVLFGETGESCDIGLNLEQFADTILGVQGSTAYLIATSKGRKAEAKVNTALRLTARTLINIHKLPRNRVRTIYAGRRQESEMQLWIVPKGGRIPKYRAGTLH